MGKERLTAEWSTWQASRRTMRDARVDRGNEPTQTSLGTWKLSRPVASWSSDGDSGSFALCPRRKTQHLICDDSDSDLDDVDRRRSCVGSRTRAHEHKHKHTDRRTGRGGCAWWPRCISEVVYLQFCVPSLAAQVGRAGHGGLCRLCWTSNLTGHVIISDHDLGRSTSSASAVAQAQARCTFRARATWASRGAGMLQSVARQLVCSYLHFVAPCFCTGLFHPAAWARLGSLGVPRLFVPSSLHLLDGRKCTASPLPPHTRAHHLVSTGATILELVQPPDTAFC